MATKIVTKNSSTASAVPTASDLVQGELAVNVADKRLFTEDNAGAIVELGTNPTTLNVNGTATMDGLTVDGDALVKPASGSAKLYLQTSNTTSDSQLIFGDSSNNNVGGVKYSHSNDAMRFETSGAEAMRIDSSGNVGIGVVPKTWYSASTALEIGSMSFEDYGVSGANVSVFANNLYRNASNAYVYKESDFAASYSQYNGEHTFNTAPSGTADSAATLTAVMKIDSSGNVGIGTSSPSTALEVSGAVTVTRSDVFNDNSTISNEGGLFTISAATGGGGGTYPMLFKTAATERMRIDSSGNLLVGKTAIGSNTVGFQVASNGKIAATVSGDETARFNRTTSDGDIIEFRKDDTTVGSIGAKGGTAYLIGSSKGLRVSGSGLIPITTGGANSDATYDIGDQSVRFKNLYLSGGVYLGGTGAANKLDDYEEGTWTSLNQVTGTNCTNISHYDSYYTKIGRLVTLSFSVAGTITSTGVETSIKFNLPFTAINSTNQGAGGTANFFIGSGADRFGVGLVFNGTTADTTSHIYIPSNQINASGSIGDMRVSMSYITT